MIKEILRASAGTGKTYQIVEKSLEPAKNKDSDYSFLKKTVFLSFSNSAAEEIKSRVYDKVASKKTGDLENLLKLVDLRIYTIHSFCFELLKIFHFDLGISSQIKFPVEEENVIWDYSVDKFFRSNWNLNFLKEKFKDENEDETLIEALYRLSIKKDLKNFVKKHGQKIFFLSDLGIYPVTQQENNIGKINIEELERKLDEIIFTDEFEENLDEIGQNLNEIVPVLKKTKRILDRIINYIGENIYLPYMYDNGTFDFDSLVYLVLKIFKKYQVGDFLSILEEEGFGFNRLFIDEAQDCDILMNSFISYFSGEDCNVEITIVGDPKQSIYRWRNAYPEEFIKMCEEVGENCHSLLETRRIKNKNTLNFINKLMLNLKNEFQDFDYTQKLDELRLPKDKKDKEISENKLSVKYCEISKDKTINEEELKKFIEKGKKTGIVFRSRSNFNKSKLGISLKDKIQYRLSEPFEGDNFYDNKSSFTEDEILDIDPDYYLLKMLVNCFETSKRDIVSAVFLLTKKGLLFVDDLFKGKFKDFKEKKDVVSFIRSSMNTYNEILKIRNYNKNHSIVENIYLLLDEKNLWKHFYRSNSLLGSERTTRMLNHALSKLYLLEISGYNIDDRLTYMLASAKVPYEFSIPFENNNDNMSFIEATTIHSSKGLTYDNVIIISDFNDLLKRSVNLSRGDLGSLFKVDFEKVLVPLSDQEIEIDYFPYLGKYPAKYIAEYIEENLQFPDGENLNNIVGLYEETLKRINSEKANLFYVAVTRTKENIMFIDIKSRNTQNSNVFLNLLKNSVNNSNMKDNFNVELNEITTPAENINNNLIVNNQFKSKEILNLESPFKFIPVREYIKEDDYPGIGLKINKSLYSFIPENLINMSIGTLVHKFLSYFIIKSPESEEYDKFIKDFFQDNDDEVKNKAKNIVEDNKEKFYKILNDSNIKFKLPELKLWGLAKSKKTFLTGVVDALLGYENSVKVLEYKTIFSRSQQQVKTGEKQIKVYRELLEKIFKNISTDVIEIKANNNEN